MPYLTKADLKSHIYQENLDQIIREDETIADDAIAAAIELAQSYLSKYELTQLFGDNDTEPVVNSSILKNTVKTIACWQLLTLGNANVNMELFAKLNDDAVKWLKDIQAGKANPAWPYADMDTATPPPNGDSIEYNSTPKRTNHW